MRQREFTSSAAASAAGKPSSLIRPARAAADRAAWVILAAALLVLATTILLSPHERVFDEVFYAEYVTLVHHYGLSMALLEHLPGATGPLFGVIHVALEPVTGLQPVWMRLATFVLFLIAIALVAKGLRLLRVADAWLIAATMLVLPMTWVAAGLALTGMPALVFVAANLVVQLRGLLALQRGERPVPWFMAAGLLLGIAVLGRQTACLLAVTPLLLAAIDRRLLVPVLVQAVIAAAMALPLVIAWHGLVPPLDDTEAGFVPENAFLALGYLLVGFLLLARAPAWLLSWRSIIFGLALLAANAWLKFALAFPLASIVDNVLNERAMYAYGIVCGAALMWAGGIFLVWVIGRAWQARGDAKVVLIHAGLVAVSLAPAFIGNQFSSRYAAMALPYLILAAAPYREPGTATNLKMALGCAFGLAALLGYYWGDLTSELVRTI